MYQQQQIAQQQYTFLNVLYLMFRNEGGGTVEIQNEGGSKIRLDQNSEVVLINTVVPIDKITFNFIYDANSDSNLIAIVNTSKNY